jgi:hypothetical protein
MAKKFEPGDVDIHKLMLYSDDGCRAFDITGQVHYMDIYESILSPIIYAELTIEDSIDLQRQFPLIAEEYVEIEYSVGNAHKHSKFKLHVKGINNLEISPQQKWKGYTISLVSMEMLKNVNQNVDRKFDGDIGTSVQKILKEYLKTDKALNIEATRGIDNVLVTRLEPLKAIDMMRRRAVSKKYLSSSFVFYENKYGYNFETVEAIFDRNKNGVGDKVFMYSSTAAADSKVNTFRNIIAYRQVSFADSIDKIQQGGLSNKVGALDLVTGGYQILNYTNNLAADRFTTADAASAGQNSSAFERLHGKTTAKTLLVPTASDRNESFLPNKLSILQAYTQKITQNLVHVYIYGDSEITAGDVIECSLPEAVADTGTPEPDRLASGKYLVAKCRHCFTLGPKPLYTQSLELIKTSFLENA